MVTFDTKVAVIVRSDLQVWQKLNVCAFLMSGIVGAAPEMLGEPYVDGTGNRYLSLSRQPVVVLSADGQTLSEIQRRALERAVPTALYIEPMFATGFDEANRAVFARYSPDTADVVGVALRAERKAVDRITKGARLHP